MPSPAQVVVLGMHRSGTSLLTHFLQRMGFWAGSEEDFPPADRHNEAGYWEHRSVWAVDEAILHALDASWCEVADLDLSRLDDGERAHFQNRIRQVVRDLDGHGSWVIKDPRLCLLLPLWREVLERPFCVLIYREPLPVARSLAARDRFPAPLGIALWEKYTREALASTRGLPRALVSHQELVTDPEAVLRRLHGFLARHRPELADLEVPTSGEIRDILDPGLVHHERAAEEERSYLTPPQLALLKSLEDGSALDGDPAPLSSGARELLADHQERGAEQRRAEESLRRAAEHAEDAARSAEHATQAAGKALQHAAVHEAAQEEALIATHARLRQALAWLDQLDDIFRATLESRSWRVGRALTGLFGSLGASSRISAAERRDQLLEEIRRWREESEK